MGENSLSVSVLRGRKKNRESVKREGVKREKSRESVKREAVKREKNRER
jgi:hypothetical protein